MAIIDDEGKLFGLVNIIDVLVVMLVLAIVLAGAVFILSPTPGEPDVRYATIDLGEQPSFIIDTLEVGDVMELEGHADNLTITDVYHGPGEDGHLIIRAEIRGERVEIGEDRWQFEFGGEPFRAGQELTVETPDFEVTGTVTSLDRSGSNLDVTETAVFASTTVSTAVADELDVGDTYTVDGHTIATIEALQLYPGVGDERVALLGLTLATHERGGTHHFGTTAVRLNATVPFETDTYDLEAEVLKRGTSDIVSTETEVVIETTVDRTVSEDIEVGDSYDIAGHSVATVETKTVYPTADRDVNRLLIGITLRTHVEDDRTFFGDQPVRTGMTVPLRTAEYDIEGDIVTRGTLVEPGEPTTTVATVQLRNVRPERAERIQVGMTEVIDGEVLAEITAKETRPAQVILESEDGNIFLREHPTNLDIELTVELQTRETATVVRFHGEDIREGDVVVLDLGRIIIFPEIVELHE